MIERTIVVDFGAPARLGDVPAMAARAFAWWIGELKSLAPAWLQSLFPKPPETVTLHVIGDTWRVGVGAAPAFELDARTDDKGLADQILAAAPNFSLSKLTVVLPASRALRRRVTLPLMSASDMRAAVGLQIDRLTPFKADAARFDVRTVARDAGAGTLEADAVFVPRAAVDAIEQRLGALGLKPAAIDVDGGDGRPLGFNVMTAAVEPAPRRAMLINAGLVCSVALVWYLAAAAWEVSREREIEGWRARIAELEPLAKRSAGLRAQLDAMAQPFAVASARRPGVSLALLNELTRIVPDTAKLTELRFAGRVVEIVGLAQDAPALIGALEASRFFKDVKFRSPVMRRPELGKERFEITMTVEVPAR